MEFAVPVSPNTYRGNHNQKWRWHEDNALRKHFAWDLLPVIASCFGRSERAVVERALKLELISQTGRDNFLASKGITDKPSKPEPFGNW